MSKPFDRRLHTVGKSLFHAIFPSQGANQNEIVRPIDGPIRFGEWFVIPRLKRLTGGDEATQIDLKTLTNFRAVRDLGSSTGWKVEIGPFPGWATVPEW